MGKAEIVTEFNDDTQHEPLKCPACNTPTLVPTRIEGLSANFCEQCGGYWLAAKNYFDWLQEPAHPAPTRLPGNSRRRFRRLLDVARTRCCPDCGAWMQKYEIGRELTFFVDHCERCKGTWVDQRRAWKLV